MPLDIGVGDGSTFSPVRDEPFLSLEDDGYYWFLHPLFERLQAETGQYIDLYGNASFVGKDLDALARVIEEANDLVEAKGESWDVHVGTQLLPSRKELYRAVQKGKFLQVLEQLEDIIARAQELKRPVVCFGD
jgi:hypothetical protein